MAIKSLYSLIITSKVSENSINGHTYFVGERMCCYCGTKVDMIKAFKHKKINEKTQ
jgi:hypothetical protein